MTVWSCSLLFLRWKVIVGRAADLEKERNNMHIEKQIEFDKIRNRWCEFAMTDAARERIAVSSLIYSETELNKNLRDTL